MKKLLSILVFALYGFMATAQVSKTVNVTTAGTLSTLLTPTELSTVTNLTVTGNIDARDVKTMRDNMPKLEVLDIVAVSIKAYTGSTGTYNVNATYPANEMPPYSFCNTLFYSNTTLKTIAFPSSITSIGAVAFYGCSGLTGSLILPNSVTKIGGSAFRECSGFTGSLTLPNSITIIESVAFGGCSGFTGNLTIPNSVTTIESQAFHSCNGFSDSLTLGSGLTNIGSEAFLKYPRGFKIINSLSIIPPGGIGSTTFYYGIPAIVFVPTSSVSAYKAAYGWSDFTIAAEKHITINVPNAGSMATAIVDGGFGPLNSITHLTVTGNINSVDISQMKTNMIELTSIDLSSATIASNALPSSAFQGRTSFTSVKLPANLLSIGEYAFDGCVSISGDIPLPASVTSIGAYAFQNCSSLSGTLNISIGVTIINNYTFSGCSGISGSLTIPSTVTSIGSYAFKSCKSLTGALTIPNTITSLGIYAFQDCSGFNGGLSIGSGITSIGGSTFSGCSGLTGGVTIPNTVTSLGTSAFYNCTGFNGTLTLSNTLTTVSASAFSGCSNLSGKVEVPLSVTSIGSSAFQGCAKITELNVGKNLTSIGDYALNGCTSLAKITVPRATPPTVYANTFTGIPVESCTINVPTGASATYQTANYWNLFIRYTETLTSDNYTVTVSIGAGGSVKENNISLGNGSVLTAAIGSNKTFTFVPNAGYAVATVTYNGADVTSQLVNFQYTTPAINANATLVVTFKKTQYLLSIKSAESGAVNLLCEYGATPSFNFIAYSGWKVNTLMYNGVDITNSLTNGVYKVPAVSADALLTVSFEQANALQVQSNSNVKVYSNSSDIIVEGSTEGEIITLFTINGKQIQSVKSQGERIAIPAQKDRMYLVKTEGRTFKVML